MLAFCGVLVAAHADRVLRRVVAGGMYAARTVVALVCAAPALLLASQAYDSRSNHWEDIAVGLLLGAVMATYVVSASPGVRWGHASVRRRPPPRVSLTALFQAKVLSRDLAREMQEAPVPARIQAARPAPEAVNRAHSYYTWKDAQAHRTPDEAYF